LSGVVGNGHGNGHAPVVLHSLDVGDAERALIARALQVCGGNRTRAAAMLGINVRTLRNKLNGKSDVRN
jgi:DNA-binding protein Fis